MINAPLVSVVIATYNMGQYVDLAIESVLAQTVGGVEVIVVDDGSTDNTRDVLRRHENDSRVRTIHQSNSGQTVAKNRGIREARGEYIGFCDADDTWLPDKLEWQLQAFEREKAAGLVYGDVELMDADGSPVWAPHIERHSGRITAELLMDNFIPFVTCLAPRRLLTELGGFDEALEMSIDYDLWLKLSAKREIIHIPRILARYRSWPGQMSHRTGDRLENAIHIMKRFLAEHPGIVEDRDIRRAWAHTFVTRACWRRRQGRSRDALTDFAWAFKQRPHDRRLWRQLGNMIVGRHTKIDRGSPEQRP